MLGWLLWACGTPPEPVDPSASTMPTATSDTRSPATADTAPPEGLALACAALPEQPLRGQCKITVPAPQSVVVTATEIATGEVLRTFASDIQATEHAVDLFLLPASTELRITAVAGEHEASVPLILGPPPPIATLDITVTGASSASAFGFQSPCLGAGAVIVDPVGRVLWAHDFAASPEGISFTEEGTVLAVLDRPDAVVEVDLAGTERLRLEQGVDYPEATHHDVFRRDGRTYVLFAEPVGGHELDGFYVFEGKQLVGTWRLADHHQPDLSRGVGSPDYSHANSVWVDEQGDVYVSLRHLSVVVKVGGVGPGFGEVHWVLGGDADDTRWPSDWALSSAVDGPASFERQHNVHLDDDGQLVLLDNRADDAEGPTRVVHLDLDEPAMEATIAEAWELPYWCDFQGGAWATAAGHPVGTCASNGQGFEFAPGQAEPVFTIEAHCGEGFIDAFVPRFVPLAW